MPATPAQNTVALANLRQDVRSRADIENDPHVTDAELTRWINAGYAQLYDTLITTFGEDYFQSTFTITTDGQSQNYPLPPDFYKLLLCELQNSMGASVNANVPNWITMQPFQLREKNKYNLINFATYFGYLNIRYRLVGSTLMFAPLPQGGQRVRIWYAPRLVPLADTGTVALGGVVAGDTLTVNGVAFQAVAGGPTGNQFLVGATDAATATNLAAAIAAANLPGVVSVVAGPTTSPIVEATPGGPAPPGSIVIQAQTDVPANVVTVTIYQAVVAWSATAHMTLAPGAQGALSDGLTPPTYTWGDTLDAVSGWTDLVAIDAALKALTKQERDRTAVERDKADMLARLDRAAPNRNLADPATVIETQGEYPYPGAPGWPGGPWF